MLGDVSGKGLSRPILMSHLHATFATWLEAPPLIDMVHAANRIFLG